MKVIYIDFHFEFVKIESMKQGHIIFPADDHVYGLLHGTTFSVTR